MSEQRCNLPPPGWWCSRPAGHEGPCAARPVGAALERVAAAARIADAETLARAFHEAYERLAPSFGYETRPETREFDPESKNGRLMIAVCREIGGAVRRPPMTSDSEDWNRSGDDL